jgi:peptide alpha-N-acetyltransferase
MKQMIDSELSEPYSIYTYRYFLRNFPELTFIVNKNKKAYNENEMIGCIIGKLELNRKGRNRGIYLNKDMLLCLL